MKRISIPCPKLERMLLKLCLKILIYRYSAFFTECDNGTKGQISGESRNFTHSTTRSVIRPRTRLAHNLLNFATIKQPAHPPNHPPADLQPGQSAALDSLPIYRELVSMIPPQTLPHSVSWCGYSASQCILYDSKSRIRSCSDSFNYLSFKWRVS